MKVFVTGSADGLGFAAAKALLDAGHEVVVHVRSKQRLSAVRELGDVKVVIGDLSDSTQTRNVAEQINTIGVMDSVIHNAGVYLNSSVFEVNVIAPYLLTALMHRPKRLVYLSSGMHLSGRPNGRTYSDTKLMISTFAAAIARRWPNVISNSVDPGWVPTKMGGQGAPDDLEQGHVTQVWLATSDDATVSGAYWHHLRQAQSHPAVNDTAFQNELLAELARVTKTPLPS